MNAMKEQRADPVRYGHAYAGANHDDQEAQAVAEYYPCQPHGRGRRQEHGREDGHGNDQHNSQHRAPERCRLPSHDRQEHLQCNIMP